MNVSLFQGLSLQPAADAIWLLLTPGSYWREYSTPVGGEADGAVFGAVEAVDFGFGAVGFEEGEELGSSGLRQTVCR